MGKYQTSPQRITTVPPGIPYIVANEAAERFSYYGMRTILTVFMTKYLLDRAGNSAPMGDSETLKYQHLFYSAAYFFPIIGAIIADAFLGKYLTILILSMFYCFGHLALALDETRLGLAIGLTLIAIGAGGIKPCVSAHVGDQFSSTNQHWLSPVFKWFYFSINFGSLFSTLLTPWLLDEVGPKWAFGVPGVLMALATLFFWMGRHKFVHIPPAGTAYLKEVFGRESLQTVKRLVFIYAFIAIFWSLYEQSSSAWVLQAEKMDLHWMGITWLPSQVQASNPLLVMILIPLSSFVLFPAISRIFLLTALRKIGIGFFLTVVSFLIPVWIEQQIADGLRPNVKWQLLAFVVLTTAEVFVYMTGLEFAYTQAPKKMKSLIMSLFLLTVSIGNLITSGVNSFITNPDGSSKLTGAEYYLFFASMMLVASILYIFVARTYKEKVYLQDEAA